MTQARTIVCQLTPRGRGAIATIVVEGPQAAAVLARCFRPHGTGSVKDFAVGRIRVGYWQSIENGSAEELVVCRTQAERYEVHCHGGQAAVAAITSALQVAGCQPTSLADEPDAEPQWRQWAQRAMVTAATRRTALILLDQYLGAFDHGIEEIETALERGEIQVAKTKLETLLRRSQLGLHLDRPWQVALVGPPNVGKSSLINALLGFERTVVFDQPGTTRDVVSAQTALGGWPVELQDTAGLRDTNDPLEMLGIERALRRSRDSDLVVFVRAADEPMTDFDRRTCELVAPTLMVINKWDRVPQATLPTHATELMTSALTGYGVDELCERIVAELVSDPPPVGAAVPFHNQQVDRLNGCLKAFERGHFDVATHLLAVCRR